MAKNKKIMLEDLIARKMQGDLDRLQVKNYNSKELGGEIEIRKIPLSLILKMMDDLGDNPTASESIEFNCQLILECCPMFKQNTKKLCEVYECQDPTRLPLLILNDNIGEISDIAEEIMSMYGIDSIGDTVKN